MGVDSAAAAPPEARDLEAENAGLRELRQRLVRERDRYGRALEQISDPDSGMSARGMRLTAARTLAEGQRAPRTPIYLIVLDDRIPPQTPPD